MKDYKKILAEENEKLASVDSGSDVSTSSEEESDDSDESGEEEEDEKA